MNLNFICGIELECAYKQLPDGVDIAPHGCESVYSENYASDHWTVEDDGSLNGSSTYPHTAEFVSAPFDLRELRSTLKEFKEIWGGKELRECINFNTSCGAHLHLTVLHDTGKDAKYEAENKGEPYKFFGAPVPLRLVLNPHFASRFRERLFKNIKDAHVFTDKAYASWIEHYFRSYARRMTPNSFIMKSERYLEWNLTIRNDHKQAHVEFRSFHLHGIKTWRQLFVMYDALSKTISEVFREELRRKKSFCTTNIVTVEPKAKAHKEEKIVLQVRADGGGVHRVSY